LFEELPLFPGAAQHFHSASKTRVNALMVVRCRPGIVPGSACGTIPALRRSAARRAAFGKSIEAVAYPSRRGTATELFPGAAQHFLSGALQTRDRSGLGVWNDPGSALQRYALHRAREKHRGRGLPIAAGHGH
jgi:hypothetical protein